MPLPSVYTNAYNQLPEFFEKIQQGQAPDSFSQQHLKDLGYASSNHRSYIPILKELGFLSSAGGPTQRYLDYRNKANARKVLGEALKESYKDIFTLTANPSEKERELIEGKFKSTHNTTERPAELMTKTFFSLLKIADVDHDEKKIKVVIPADTSSSEERTSKKRTGADVGLHYNIQIHLPATKDTEVYNSIFKSLKEHLID